MVVLKGTIQDGEVRLSEPADLPDGTEVTVLANGAAAIGIPDSEWPTDAAGISRLLARMNAVEPLEISAAEEAEIELWREKVREYSLTRQATAGSSFE